MDELLERLYATTDAAVWAREWCKIARKIQAEGGEVVDEGWMIGWFANAIETAKTQARRDLGLDNPDAMRWMPPSYPAANRSLRQAEVEPS